MEHTARSFIRRGKSCIYGDPKYRESALAMLRLIDAKGMLNCVKVSFQGIDVGLGLWAVDEKNKNAVYLFNLYKPFPNNASGAVILGVIQSCAERGMAIDGMRGAFSQKRKFGFLPQSSYAIVNDETWEIRAPDDLSSEEMEVLYRRRFGALDSRN